MTVGFTGSRHGMTDAQQFAVFALIAHLAPAKVVHGGAEGADTQVDGYCAGAGIPRKLWPANSTAAKVCPAEEVMPVKPPLDRNRDIVRDADVMIAAPLSDNEAVRSGTWATVRFARKMRRPLHVVKRDGTVVSDK